MNADDLLVFIYFTWQKYAYCQEKNTNVFKWLQCRIGLLYACSWNYSLHSLRLAWSALCEVREFIMLESCYKIGNDDVNWRNTQTKSSAHNKVPQVARAVILLGYSHSAPIVLYDTIIMLLMPHNIHVLVIKHINIALIYTRILMQCLKRITNALFIIQNMCPNLSKLKKENIFKYSNALYTNAVEMISSDVDGCTSDKVEQNSLRVRAQM